MQVLTAILAAALISVASYLAVKGLDGWGWFLFCGFVLAGMTSDNTLISFKA